MSETIRRSKEWRLRGFAGGCALLTTAWVLTLGILMARSGPLETASDALMFVTNPGILYTLNYGLASAITVAAMGLMVTLGMVFLESRPQVVVFGWVFVPVYGVLNLWVYLSQISLVPSLAAVVTEGSPEAWGVLQMIQAWPESAMALANGLAYAALAVPSVCFGVALVQSRRASVAGGLLAFNGVFCVVGVLGMMSGSDRLSMGLMIGGVLFLVSAGLLGLLPLREE